MAIEFIVEMKGIHLDQCERKRGPVPDGSFDLAFERGTEKTMVVKSGQTVCTDRLRLFFIF